MVRDLMWQLWGCGVLAQPLEEVAGVLRVLCQPLMKELHALPVGLHSDMPQSVLDELMQGKWSAPLRSSGDRIRAVKWSSLS